MCSQHIHDLLMDRRTKFTYLVSYVGYVYNRHGGNALIHHRHLLGAIGQLLDPRTYGYLSASKTEQELATGVSWNLRSENVKNQPGGPAPTPSHPPHTPSTEKIKIDPPKCKKCTCKEHFQNKANLSIKGIGNSQCIEWSYKAHINYAPRHSDGICKVSGLLQALFF